MTLCVCVCVCEVHSVCVCWCAVMWCGVHMILLCMTFLSVLYTITTTCDSHTNGGSVCGDKCIIMTMLVCPCVCVCVCVCVCECE